MTITDVFFEVWNSWSDYCKIFAEVCGQTKDALQSRSEEMCWVNVTLFQRPLLCTWTVVLLLCLYFVGFSWLFIITTGNFWCVFWKWLENNSGSWVSQGEVSLVVWTDLSTDWCKWEWSVSLSTFHLAGWSGVALDCERGIPGETVGGRGLLFQ